MNAPPIDLRSDTMTRPTPAMRAAMAAAEVGDDMIGEDPTVTSLESRIASLLGKEAAVFVPSGTMSNQLGIRVHCQPGDELICETNCHIFQYEQAGYAQLFGIAAQPIEGDFGILQLDQLRDRIRPDDPHAVRTRLICIENTHNRGGGRVQPFDTLGEICEWAAENGLARHLDGSRIFNAAIATGIPADAWAAHFDTVNVCFSKGLGAPVGSALCGPEELIRRAHRHRQALGGAMRQSGIIAAGALYALNNNIDRLAEDHAKARALADAIRNTPGFTLDPDAVDTNIVIFKVAPELATAAEFVGRLRQRGVLMYSVGKRRIRAVAHLDVSLEDVRRAGEIIHEAASASLTPTR